MKKLFVIAIAALALSVTSCESKQEKAERLSKEIQEAVQNGDIQKSMELSAEYSKVLSEIAQEEGDEDAAKALDGVNKLIN